MGKYSFIGLLALFGTLVLLALGHIMSAEQRPYVPRESGVAAWPHAPAEFNEILNFDALEGLNKASGEYKHPPPPLQPDNWPCSKCHEKGDFSSVRRELTYHEEIQLNHDEGNRWCLDCHDKDNRDMLHLTGGKKITFDESYRLCGQCHGDIFRDWRLGIHGKRTGYWNGPKRYLLCVHCHSPHAPAFKGMKPLPPPVRPEFYRPDSARDAAAGKAAKYSGGRHQDEH